ncbi:hypothetical protein EZV62_016922 [Acer yangbiense]|uniref:Uncharacterized protein n=1 Tax=Acer yangbiense TaxID=1000413 RepID=A0A5C7HPU2_9ROSI|nr:hypothetical protein EZV62_016922 [Acer yangbiense]
MLQLLLFVPWATRISFHLLLGKDELKELKNELYKVAYDRAMEKVVKKLIKKKEFKKMCNDAIAANEIYKDYFWSVIEKNICQIFLDEGNEENIEG